MFESWWQMAINVMLELYTLIVASAFFLCMVLDQDQYQVVGNIIITSFTICSVACTMVSTIESVVSMV